MTASGSESALNQETNKKFQQLQDQMSMMMNQFQRMSIVASPFSQADASPAAHGSFQGSMVGDPQLQDKVRSLEEKNMDLLQTNSGMSKQIVSL